MKKFENNSIGLLDYMIYANNSSLVRDNILIELDRICSAGVIDQARDTDIRRVYLSTYKDLIRDAARYREAAGNDPSILKKKGLELSAISAQSALAQLNDAFNAYFSENNIQPCEGKEYFGVDPEELRDTVRDVCREFRAIDTLENIGKNRMIDLMFDDVDILEEMSKSDYKYTPSSEYENDVRIEEMHFMREARAAEYAKKGILWKIFHPIQTINTISFLNRTEKALAKLGFNAAEHSANARARLESEPPSFLKGQIVMAEQACEEILNNRRFAEWRKANPIINVARDKLEKATKACEDKDHPERGFAGKVKPLLNKYKVSLDKQNALTNINENYISAAKNFDMGRETGILGELKTRKFIEVSNAFLSGAMEKGGPINIKEILNDANKFVVTELQTFTVVYEYDHEALKDIAKGGVMAKINPEFLKKTILDSIQGKLDETKVEKIKDEINETIEDHIQNRDKYYEEEMQMLKSKESVKEPFPLPHLKEELNNGDVAPPVSSNPSFSKDNIIMS